MSLSIRLFAPLLFLACAVYGQTTDDKSGLCRQLQSVAFGSGTMTDGSSLYWSLGEMSTTLLESKDNTLSQGFWQIAIPLTGPETESPEAGQLQITCFPNPLSAELSVTWTGEIKNLRASLYSLEGQILETALLGGRSHRFNFAERREGHYLLRFDDESGTHIQTFKLQKLK